MLTPDHAISRIRRDLTLSALLRYTLLAGALACLLVGPIINVGMLSGLVLTIIGVIWVTLSFRSAKSSQMTQASSSLIAAGQWDRAEQQIEQSLRSFSLFRTNKLMSLHHLALLRHAQNRYPETAVLCRALLGQRLGSLTSLSKSSRLILADALLEMGDVRGAYDAFMALHSERLALGEAVQLLATEMDYSSRVGAWDYMLSAVMTKVQLAELMPTNGSAIVQALLALAAKKMDRVDLSDWLKRRAALLADPEDLMREKPVLKELFEGRSQEPEVRSQ
jgi:hypothetical protein